MIYKFKSKASGDIVMLGAHGAQMLELMGREPAARGIIEPAQIPAALAALRAAIAAEKAGTGGAPATVEDSRDGEAPVALHRRLWPMIDMLERAAAAEVPIVWGV